MSSFSDRCGYTKEYQVGKKRKEEKTGLVNVIGPRVNTDPDATPPRKRLAWQLPPFPVLVPLGQN